MSDSPSREWIETRKAAVPARRAVDDGLDRMPFEHREFAAMQARAESAEAEVARLTEWLRAYGVHFPGCEKYETLHPSIAASTPCICGLDALLAGSPDGARPEEGEA